jgi:hypothetical protein
MLDVLG